MTPDLLRARLATAPQTFDDAFDILSKASRLVIADGGTNPEIVDIVVRIEALRGVFLSISETFEPAISGLCRNVGLFPYIPETGTAWEYRLTRELFRSPSNDGTVLHAEQAKVLNRLIAGEGIALSAPTSFGKSLLIDILIRARNVHTAVIVVPTIALLDETRRRLTRKFSSTHQVITLHSQERRSSATIYIGTQERILERPDIDDIDLLVIDEFYKLDMASGDDRATSLNVLLAKYGPKADQLYLLGPLVEHVDIAGALAGRVSFHKSEFSPVAADLIDLTGRRDNLDALVEVLHATRSESTLIFSGSPPRANSLALALVKRGPSSANQRLTAIADWLAANFHASWSILEPLRCGYGVHHGRVPRAVAQLIVKLFETRDLRVLVCTSTLIEGVNTSARNVCVYDKTINGTRNLNYFQFQNIKGRAGRLGRHFVGKIYLFYNPPKEEAFEPYIPALGEFNAAPEEFLVQLPDHIMDEAARVRRGRALRDRALPASLIERWGRFGVPELERLTNATWDLLEQGDRSLTWSGYGKYAELLASAEVLWSHLNFEKNDITHKQFAFFANRLRSSAFIKTVLSGVTENASLEFPAERSVEKFFGFLKGAEYTFPTMMDMLNDVVNAFFPEGAREADYSVFTLGLRNWFLPGCLKGFDEYGVPLPLIQKAKYKVDNRDFDLAFEQLRELASTDFFTPIEREILHLCLQR